MLCIHTEAELWSIVQRYFLHDFNRYTILMRVNDLTWQSELETGPGVTGV